MTPISKNKYFIFGLGLSLLLALFFYILTSYNVNSCKEGLSPSVPGSEEDEPGLIEDTGPLVADKPAALPGKFLFNDMFDFDLNKRLVKLQQFFFG
jgi:hypothetical protein